MGCFPLRVLLAVVLLAVSGCGGGGGGGGGSAGGGGTPGVGASQVCSGDCAAIAITQAQAEAVIARAVAQAQALGLEATVAVVDHVGNVLGVFQMSAASTALSITTNRGVGTGLDGVELGDALADALGAPATAPLRNGTALGAISKAGTAAFLSTQGNAFTTRTASHIIQENFSPGEFGRAGGPLFGVQFSQLPCSDFSKRFSLNALEGPKRMPLGFSADPGGIPLYIEGVPVGGVGVEIDGIYTLDPVIQDDDVAPEELVASAAAVGLQAPEDRRADRIAVDGRLLRFADDEVPVSTPPTTFASIDGIAGMLIDVPGFYTAAGGVLDGVIFQAAPSGIVLTTFDGIPAEILTDTAGTPRFPPIDSLNPAPAVGLDSFEVRTILREALKVAERARAQIRRPGGSKVKVSITAVDLDGNVLGVLRGVDAPIFGIEVSAQKARTASFFSQVGAGAALQDPASQVGSPPLSNDVGTYVDAVRAFLGDPTALANGIAFSDRAGGNLARPFFPDGIQGRPSGPFSRPFASWSPFSTGLQLDLVLGTPSPADTFGILSYLLGNDPMTCTPPPLQALRGGIQIFPGSVPIFRGSTLVGGLGISGDGVDQDDMIAFLGVHNAGVLLGTGVGNAPVGIRADNISVAGVHLRFVSCPFSPFLDSSAQNVCEGL